MIKTAKILVLVTLPYLIHSQTNPDYGSAFLQDEVASIRIELEPESLEHILNQENWGQEEVPATFIYESSELTDTLYNIGFRLRGNTSLQAGKKSFKVSFNSFQSGKRWQGLKKLNLNGEHNDVSIMRSKICWESLREFDLPASRTSYVDLYVNDEYRGVYLNVEHIDDLFIESRFSHGNGNLYKCTYPADLKDLGNSVSNYQINAYELKTNEWETSTHQDLRDLIHFLDEESTASQRCNLFKELNIHGYIKSLAAEIILGHWDGHAFNKNNFYLYHNKAQQRWEWIHYDMDNTMGIDWFGEDWSNRNIYDWANPWDDRPLVEAILENDEWRDLLTLEIENFLTTAFNYGSVSAKTTAYKNLLSSHVQNDIYYTLDYGFSHEDFLNSDTESLNNHVTQGILEYVNERVSSALSQLETSDNSTFGVLSISDNLPLINDQNIIIEVETHSSDNSELTVFYSFNGTDWLNAPLTSAMNGISFATFTTAPENNEIEYYVQYESAMEVLEYPCAPILKSIKPISESLVINEVVADNETGITDEEGKYEDWIELYNTGSITGIGQFYLSDDITFLNKWELPEELLPAESHTLFWADDDAEDGAYHTNFKLDAGGDGVYLSRTFGDGFSIVDFISYEDAPEDESFGRSEDGNPDWIWFSEPTPNATNNSVHIYESSALELLKVFPNPTQQLVHLQGLDILDEWDMINSSGASVLRGSSKIIDLSDLSFGIYIIRTPKGAVRIIKE